MAKSRRPSAQAGAAARGAASPGPHSGRGAGSALEEMLRRQAQNPRPGSLAQPPGSGQDGSAPKAHRNGPRDGDHRKH
jgi:hypothetical protein